MVPGQSSSLSVLYIIIYGLLTTIAYIRRFKRITISVSDLLLNLVWNIFITETLNITSYEEIIACKYLVKEVILSAEDTNRVILNFL